MQVLPVQRSTVLWKTCSDLKAGSSGRYISSTPTAKAMPWQYPTYIDQSEKWA